MSLQSRDQYFWCSFEARQDHSIVIEYIVFGFQFILIALISFAYHKARKQNQLEHLSMMYKLIIAWLACFFLKTLFNVIAYSAYIHESPSNPQNHFPQNDDDQINFGGLRVMSSIFLFLDFTTTFFLQICMIYIPYLWMKNALELLTDIDLDVEERIKINRISWFLGLVRKYLLFRNIYILYFIAIAITIMATDSFKSFGSYIPITSIIQSFVILILYPVGLRTYYLIKQKISLNQKQAKSMLIEYMILLFCNVVRIILNSTFYYSKLVDYIPDKYCYDNHSDESTTMNCLFLGFGVFLMHIVPGAMILYIYWPSDKNQVDLKNSLLISASDNKLY